MSQARRVARNTSFLTIGQVLAYGMNALFLILLARYLGVDGFGVWNFAVALTAFFSIFVNFGLGTLATREIARDPASANKYLGHVIPIQVIFGVIAFSVSALLVNVLGYSQQTIYVVYILTVGIVVTTISSQFSSVFQAFERMGFTALATIISNAAALCGAVIGILLHVNVVGIALFYLIANGVALAFSYALCARDFFVPQLGIDVAFWRNVLKEAWPMAVLALGVLLYFRIDVIILSLLKGDAAVGLYSVAYNFSEATTVVPTMFISALFPVLSRLHQEKSKQSFTDVCAKSIKYMLCIALPMAFTVTLWAPAIIITIFGSAYSGSVLALQIIIWSAVAMYVSIILGRTFIAANLQALNMKIVMTTVVFNVILNVLVIPRYSYIGASYTTVATEVWDLSLCLYFLRRYGHDLGLRSASGPPILGLSVIAASTVLLWSQNVPLLLTTVIDLAVYAAIIYKLGLTDDDKLLIAAVLKRSGEAEAET